MHISKKPSTTVRIPSVMVSLENKGTGGSDAQEARDRMWLTIDTYKYKEARQHIITKDSSKKFT
jgi:hypothetical protein